MKSELLAKVFFCWHLPTPRLRRTSRTHPPLRVPLPGGELNLLSFNSLRSPPLEGWPKAGVGFGPTFFATDLPKILFFAFTLFTLAFAEAEERRFYPCHRLEQPPLIDGKTDDKAWENIPDATGFYVFGSDGKYAVEAQTYFKAGWTADALYVQVCSDENSPEKIVGLLKDGGDLWKEDSIELFIHPGGAPGYAHMVVNTLGSRRNKLRSTADWEAKAVVGTNNWTMEARIPFAALMQPAPQEGDEWAVNIARNRLTGSANERHTSWPLLFTGFHDLPNFGRFAFKSAVDSGKKTEENEINQGYLRDLSGKITKFISLAPEYEKDLSGFLKFDSAKKTIRLGAPLRSEATARQAASPSKSDSSNIFTVCGGRTCGEPGFSAESKPGDRRAEAETLLKEWQQLRSEASSPDTDCRRLATLCNDLSALRQKSDDCIARGIMERLFGK